MTRIVAVRGKRRTAVREKMEPVAWDVIAVWFAIAVFVVTVWTVVFAAVAAVFES